jgi:hypothetical protein
LEPCDDFAIIAAESQNFGREVKYPGRKNDIVSEMAIEPAVKNYLNLLHGNINVCHHLSLAVSRFIVRRSPAIPSFADGMEFGMELNYACRESRLYRVQDEIPPQLYEVLAVRLERGAVPLVVHSAVVVDIQPLRVLNVNPFTGEVVVFPFEQEYASWSNGTVYLMPRLTTEILIANVECVR